MPFQSEKQRRYLWANEPEIARDWTDTYGSRIKKNDGGIMNAVPRQGYFIGGVSDFFSDVVGTVSKAAKKVFKSPIGKAAIMYGVGFGIPGTTFGGLFGRSAGSMFGQASGMLPTSWKNKLLMKHLGKKDGVDLGYKGLDWGKAAVLASPLLAATKLGDIPEEDEEDFDHDLLRDQYAQELMKIKKESMERSLDQNEWNYLGVKDGGRIGYYAGGQSIPSDYTMEDAMMTTTQDKLGGITDVMKQADLNRQGSVGQFYAADGGRIGFRYGKTYGSQRGAKDESALMQEINFLMKEFGLSKEEALKRAISSFRRSETPSKPFEFSEDMIADMKSRVYPSQIKDKLEPIAEPFYPHKFPNLEPIAEPFYPNDPKWKNLKPELMAQGGRIGAEEGGLMNLGGMEKDYRQEGGFVPLGGQEKADDVPARLSKNEFVFTADAVRGAGGGDIDKGAEVMENIMKNLEQGGQISEETQGLGGAQEMFDVSERLSEVV